MSSKTIYALSAKAKWNLLLTFSSLVIKLCHYGGNSTHGWRKIEFCTASLWTTFFSIVHWLDRGILTEGGRFGGLQLPNPFGALETTWFSTTSLLTYLNWWTDLFISLGLGWGDGKRILLFLFTNGPLICLCHSFNVSFVGMGFIDFGGCWLFFCVLGDATLCFPVVPLVLCFLYI